MSQLDAVADRKLSRAELNAKIAEALGWQVWQDPRPGREGLWFMEREARDGNGNVKDGQREVRVVPDYVAILRDDVKMLTGDLRGL